MDWLDLFILSAAFAAGFRLLQQWPRCSIGADHPSQADNPVTLIIPARNEESNLPVLLGSLRRQSRVPDEILVVDDHSDDRTAEVAKRLGAKVVEAPPLPPGWTGKNWALHQGVRESNGRVLFFLDADAFFAVPDGYEKILDTFSRTGGALSVQPYHIPQGWLEQFSAFFNLTMAAATRGVGRNGRGSGLVGPSLIIARKDYARLGGHRSVRQSVLENLQLGRKAQSLGLPCQTCNGKGALYYRMYSSGIGDLFRGWSKAFFQGMVGIPWPSLALIVLWFVGVARAARLAILSFWGGGLDPWVCGAFYILFAGQSFFLFNEVGRFRTATAGFYPIAFVYFVAVLCYSAGMRLLGREAVWKGRTVPGSSRNKK